MGWLGRGYLAKSIRQLEAERMLNICKGGVIFIAQFFALQMDDEAARDGLWEIGEDAFA